MTLYKNNDNIYSSQGNKTIFKKLEIDYWQVKEYLIYLNKVKGIIGSNKTLNFFVSNPKKHLTTNKQNDILETSQEQTNTWQKRVQSLAHFTLLHSGHNAICTP